jgi:hypothetical protein
VTVFVRAELKCIMTVNGEQSAMAVGASMMQMWFANKLVVVQLIVLQGGHALAVEQEPYGWIM